MALGSTPRARLQATLAFLGCLIFAWRSENVAMLVLAGATAVPAATAWLAPPRYAPIQRMLDRAVHALLAGFTWFVLALVYFGLFTPLRLWRTIRRDDPLGLRRPKRPVSTYLRPILNHAGARRFDRQF
jgi:hypothetical protein